MVAGSEAGRANEKFSVFGLGLTNIIDGLKDLCPGKTQAHITPAFAKTRR